LQAVKPCVLVWQSPASSGRRKSCLHAFELGTIAWPVCMCFKMPTSAPIQCGVHTEGVPMFWQLPNIPWSRKAAWHPRRWLTLVCSRWGGCAYFTDSVLFFCLSHFICIVVSGVSLCHTQPLLLSLLNSAFIIISSYSHICYLNRLL
jgi:hypothetical protein